ncbi:hypothetical protein J2W35_004155 [Variovorax boronicumulans]|nr:hypothetical protein [Variovorax boronicumulans]
MLLREAERRDLRELEAETMALALLGLTTDAGR